MNTRAKRLKEPSKLKRVVDNMFRLIRSFIIVVTILAMPVLLMYSFYLVWCAEELSRVLSVLVVLIVCFILNYFTEL